MKKKPKLTIGMAVYDDWEGIYFTIQSLLLHHLNDRDDFEILIFDNNPESKQSKQIKQFANNIRSRNVKYFEYTFRRSTAIRNMVFEKAKGDYVLCLDCHVLLEPGAIDNFLKFFETNPESNDLLHGPMVYSTCAIQTNYMNPTWGGYMYGQWADTQTKAQTPDEPFEIPGHGMGLFGCRRRAWLGFNEDFIGFGGEEYYIHEKFRQAGRRVMCLPGLRWAHRFGRPDGVPYPNIIEERFRNYLLGWKELKLELDEMKKEFSKAKSLTATKREKMEIEVDRYLDGYSKYRTMCINVPRTGSVSVMKALQQPFDFGNEVIDLQCDMYNNRLTIACVRNPYERFISAVNIALQPNSMFHKDDIYVNRHPDAKQLKNKQLDEIVKLLTKGRLGSGHFWRQMDYIQDLTKINVILRYETLQADWAKLNKTHDLIDVVEKDNLEMVDVDTPFFTVEQLDDNLKAAIYEFYKRDFEALGYDR